MDLYFHLLQILLYCVFSSRLWTKFCTISYLMRAAFTVHSRRQLSSCNCTRHLTLITEHVCPRKYFRVRYPFVRIKWQYRYRLFLRFLRFSSLNPCELRGRGGGASCSSKSFCVLQTQAGLRGAYGLCCMI